MRATAILINWLFCKNRRMIPITILTKVEVLLNKRKNSGRYFDKSGHFRKQGQG